MCTERLRVTHMDVHKGILRKISHITTGVPQDATIPSLSSNA